MSFSYLLQEKLYSLDLESFSEGDAIHIRTKSTQKGFGLEEEKRIFMELYEKYGMVMRAQFQNDGFWGTGLRNDGKRGDFSLPQGTEDYEWNKQKGLEPQTDPWPRMYTKEWEAGRKP